MKVYNVSVKDNETGLEMLLSDVSYNKACFWIEGQQYGDGEHEAIQSINVIPHYNKKLHGYNTITVLHGKYRNYLYDETRGILVGD